MRLLDVAPTVLTLLGMDVPQTMRGSTLLQPAEVSLQGRP